MGQEAGDPIDQLRSVGLKTTPQRVAILTELIDADGHPTADQLHATVQERTPTVSLSTVYETLTRFEETGLAHRFHTTDGIARYEPATEPHVNLVCTRCEEVEDVSTPALERLLGSVRRTDAWEVPDQVLQVRGICPACQASGTSSRREQGGPSDHVED